MLNKKKSKILIVALPNSIHSVRWLEQIADQEWEIHFFPSIDCNELRLDSGFRNIIAYFLFYGRRQKTTHPSQKLKGIPVFSTFLSDVIRWFFRTKLDDKYRVRYLNYLIKKIKPDIIHSIEFQHGGYLVSEAKKQSQSKFPTWIATNWGSDIYLFGQLKMHEKKIREILENCDYYSCECQRDICLAKDYGLKGITLPVFPNTGGFDLEKIKKLRVQGKVSKRKFIALKGYQNWSGRALVGLRALERCADVLGGYKIGIFSTFKGSDVEMAAELFTKRTGIETKVFYETSHQNILRLHGQARISLGVNISDAISTSLLEAMMMGSFPIQSNTSCADEWIEDGKTGILVPPEDSEIIERAIRKALTDDKLVDEASRLNWKVAQERLDEKILKKQTINFYHSVFKETKGND